MTRTLYAATTLVALTLAGFATIGAAQAQSSSSAPKGIQSGVPLPQDSTFSPARPNCYPDLNHCADYPTGDTVKDNADQFLTPLEIQQQAARKR